MTKKTRIEQALTNAIERAIRSAVPDAEISKIQFERITAEAIDDETLKTRADEASTGLRDLFDGCRAQGICPACKAELEYPIEDEDEDGPWLCESCMEQEHLTFSFTVGEGEHEREIHSAMTRVPMVTEHDHYTQHQRLRHALDQEWSALVDKFMIFGRVMLDVMSKSPFSLDDATTIDREETLQRWDGWFNGLDAETKTGLGLVLGTATRELFWRFNQRLLDEFLEDHVEETSDGSDLGDGEGREPGASDDCGGNPGGPPSAP